MALLAAFIAWLYIDNSNSMALFDNRNNIILIAAGATAGLWIYFGWLVVIIQRGRARRELRDRRLLGEAREEIKEAERELIGGSEDFRTLWGLTQKQLDYYHKIATGQAERSFLYGQIASAVGFAVIIIASLIGAFSTSTAGAIAATVTGVSGGGLAAYVGATFMKSQESAASQLRAYFLQPLELSKYLAAERLLSFIDETDRTTVVGDMVRSIVQPPGNSVGNSANGQSQ